MPPDFRRAGRERLAPQFPSLTEARNLFGEVPPLRRCEAEARLLAGQTDDEIAKKCHLTPTAVERYHSVFFDIRSRLGSDLFISNVIGKKHHSGLTLNDHEEMSKLCGYALGGFGVDAVLDFIANPLAIPSSLATFGDDSLKELRRKLDCQMLVLSYVMPAVRPDKLYWMQWLIEGGKEVAACNKASQVRTAQAATATHKPVARGGCLAPVELPPAPVAVEAAIG